MQRTNIHLEDHQLRTLKHLAAEDRGSVAAIVRRAVDAYLDQVVPEDCIKRDPANTRSRRGRIGTGSTPVDETNDEPAAAREFAREQPESTPAIQIPWPSQHHIARLCRRHHIRWLAVFGSILRDDFAQESDVDVLVEFEDGKTPGLAFIDIQDELSTLFAGYPVDLGTRRSLNRRIRDTVLAEARVLYDAA